MQLTLHTGDDEDDNSCEKSSLKSLCLKLMGAMGIFHLIMLNLNVTENYLNKKLNSYERYSVMIRTDKRLKQTKQ